VKIYRVIITTMDQEDRPATVDMPGDSFLVNHTGMLVVRNADLVDVATFAAGYWIAILTLEQAPAMVGEGRT
jgi:hypothetical protein